jgi:hypothetical protein
VLNRLKQLLRDQGVDERLVFWCAVLAGGFVYTAGVLCGRENPFLSRAGGYGEFLKLMLTAPALYWFSARHALMRLRPLTRGALLWNGAGFLLPFFTGLHFFYLQRISVINYSLTPRDIARMPPVGVVVFLAGGLLIAALAGYHLYLARREKILAPYALSFAGAVLFIAAITGLYSGSYYIHVHHYFLFGFFVPWLRFRDTVSVAALGLCSAVYVEGVSEWGMATLWYSR